MEILIRSVSSMWGKARPCANAVIKTVSDERTDWLVDVKTIEDIISIGVETGFEIGVKPPGIKGFYDSDKDVPILVICDDWRE